MAYCSPVQRDAFLGDLGAAQRAARAGIVPSRATAVDNTWKLWATFCHDLRVDPWLSTVEDPVSLLQVFGERYRTGEIAPHRHIVRSRTVEGALRAIGQTFSSVGSRDPRLTPFGKTEFRIRRQLTGYAKQDPPPNRAKPIPYAVLHHILHLALAHGTAEALAVADMIITAFFFLLRPGEYSEPNAENKPFHLNDVQFHIGGRRITAMLATKHDLISATFVTLEFTDQKNSVRGEVVGLARSGNPYMCPVVSVSRRVQHLRQHNAPSNTPLCGYYRADGVLRFVNPSDITTTLRFSVAALGPALGFLPGDVSARSLRAAGAMALLCAHVDGNSIRLLGRWRSDTMLRYFTVQAQPIMRNFARLMLQGAQYTLLPNQTVPNPQDI